MLRSMTGILTVSTRVSKVAIAIAASSSLLACGPKRVVTHLPTPPERLVCEAAGERPALPAQYRIDWNSVTSVAAARAEHNRYVSVEVERNGIVAGYLLTVEGKLFLCFNNMQWRREYEAGLGDR